MKKTKKVSKFNLENQEKVMISKALDHNDGHVRKTASDLGICPVTLYSKMKKYEININDYR